MDSINEGVEYSTSSVIVIAVHLGNRINCGGSILIKASFIVLLFASALSFSCSKALNVEPEPLLQKPGYDHSGKPVSSLTAAQKKDFFSFMQEAGRVEDSAGILNSTTPGTQPRSDDAKTQKMASQMGKCKMTSLDTSSLSNPSRYEKATLS